MQAVRRHADRPHASRVALQRAHKRAIGQEPDARRPVARPRDHVQAVRRHADREHEARVALQRTHVRAIAQEPYARRLVERPRIESDDRWSDGRSVLDNVLATSATGDAYRSAASTRLFAWASSNSSAWLLDRRSDTLDSSAAILE